MGKKIKVQVSFTDELSGEEERTSAAYPSSGTVTAAGTNTAPTAANNTVTTGEDRAYTFTAADFGFADTDAGAALASVKIVTPPAPDLDRHGGRSEARIERHAHLQARPRCARRPLFTLRTIHGEVRSAGTPPLAQSEIFSIGSKC